MTSPVARRRPNTGQQVMLLLVVVAVLWFLEIADALIWQGGLDAYGIRPRTWAGLGHILIAPFLHAGIAHLAANTVPLFILGWLVMLRRTSDFFTVSLIAALVSGLGVWLLGGSATIHVGASGVIFGYLGYLLGRAYFERSLTALLMAVVAGLLYGGMVWGVLPLQPGVSWLGHLFGLVGGALAAYLLADRA
jgi:membrane associated rhomboid family serine protease